ncbi:MAG: VanZ family protein [Flavobacteriaceae bacterium]|nr:VanZ family protein [Flavobacteriaceae bacterium]
MLKDIKKLLERNSFVIAVSITLLIIYLSLAHSPSVVSAIPVSDKSLHGFAYFGLTISWLFAFKKSHKDLKTRVLIGFLLLVMGAALEYLQGRITNYRTPDYLDIVANTFGIIIAIVSYRRLLRFYATI